MCQCYKIASRAWKRGSNETVGSPHNGNFLGVMELLRSMTHSSWIAHIQQHANRGHGHTNYQSSTTFEELIHLLGTHIIKKIVSRISMYGNALNMSGRYNGIQAHTRNVNDLAVFVPCTAHSLNLVGQAAVGCCRAAVPYFDFVQQLDVCSSDEEVKA